MARVLVVEVKVAFVTVRACDWVGTEVWEGAQVAKRCVCWANKLRGSAPDLDVFDVMLPDLDGFEVCKRVRLDGVDVPILFLTARDGTDDRLRGLTIGGDDYLTKPFSVEELVARVR